MKVKNEHELRLCTDSEMRRFIPTEELLGWYPQALCFKDRDNVLIERNWFMSNYSMPFITVSYCVNSTENDNWCKSKPEIDLFLEENSSFFVHMRTLV